MVGADGRENKQRVAEQEERCIDVEAWFSVI
jgi:hypothetical protein